MSRSTTRSQAKTAEPEFDFWKRLKEISLFFAGRSREHKTLRRLTRNLDNCGICHAFVGAMAVDFHHAAAKRHEFVRTTSDVNVLLTPEGLAEFRRLLVPRGYGPLPGRSRRFLDRRQRVVIGVVVAGAIPGCPRSVPIASPDPQGISVTLDGIKVANVHALIEMKLAGGRYQDLADVVSLIGSQNLDASYAARLHRSLRAAFAKCIEETRREEQFLKRNG